MAGKATILLLSLLVAHDRALKVKRPEHKLVLLTDVHDNMTSLVIQMAAEQAILRVTEEASGHPTSSNDDDAPSGVWVKQTSWPADLRPFRFTKSRLSHLCLSTGRDIWSYDQSLSLMYPIFSGADVLLLVGVTSSCGRAEALVPSSSWGCTPPVLLAPLGCGAAADGHLLPVGPVVGAALEKVIGELRVAGEVDGGDGGTRVTLLVDSTTRPLLEELAPELLHSTHINVVDARQLSDVTSHVYRYINGHRDAYRLFVVLISTLSFKVFDVAREMELLSPVQTWVVLTLEADPADLGRHFRSTDNVVVIDLRHRFQQLALPRRISGVITGSTPYLEDLYHTISITTSETLSRIRKGTLRSFTDCQLKLTASDVKARLRAMTSLRVWSTSLHTSSLTFIGFMNPYSSLPFQLAQPFRGFHGRVFNITTVPNKMFQILQEDGTFRGLAFDMLNEIARNLNFSYQIVAPPDGQWGARREDGSWTGMVGMVMNREVDFAVGSFTITAGREEAIDFTFPYWQGSAGMIMRTNSDEGRLLVHLRPFSAPVWACLLAAAPLCALTLWGITALSEEIRRPKGTRDNRRFGPGAYGVGRGIMEVHNARIGQGVTIGGYNGLGINSGGRTMANGGAHGYRAENGVAGVGASEAGRGVTGNRGSKGPKSFFGRLKWTALRLNANTPGLSKLLLMSIGLPLQQSLSWLPSRGSGRVALGLSWLVFVVLAATYTGNLTAFLAVPKVGVPVDSLDDLAAQTEYSVGLVKGQAINDIFMNAPEDTLYNRIWAKIAADPSNVLPNQAAGHRLVVTSNFIYLDDIKNLVAIQKEEADRGVCGLYIAKQEFYFSGYAFPLQTNSPYLYIFNQEILKILSSGLTEKWMRRYWPKAANKCGLTKIVVKPTSFDDVMGLFYLLLIGIGTSALVFSLEVIYSRSRNKDFGRQHL